MTSDDKTHAMNLAELAQWYKDAEIPDDIAAKLLPLAKPSVWIKTETAEDKNLGVGTTKLGGMPDLAVDTAWPIRSAYDSTWKNLNLYCQDAKKSDKELSWLKTPEAIDHYRRAVQEKVRQIQNAVQLPFLAQINFAEVALAGPLCPEFPTEGLLSFFTTAAFNPGAMIL